jgi:hypothetical protein
MKIIGVMFEVPIWHLKHSCSSLDCRVPFVDGKKAIHKIADSEAKN